MPVDESLRDAAQESLELHAHQLFLDSAVRVQYVDWNLDKNGAGNTRARGLKGGTEGGGQIDHTTDANAELALDLVPDPIIGHVRPLDLKALRQFRGMP